MRNSALFACAAAFLGTANAAPGAYYEQQAHQVRDVEMNTLVAREPPSPTAPWVEIDKNGNPSTTYTPSYTQEGGSSSLIDAAPTQLTDANYTLTWYGEYETRTDGPPNPQPTGKNKDGVFTRCFNEDGDNAPFCAPAANSELWIGDVYYVTWDPDFYKQPPKDNRTIQVALRLDWYNETSEEWDKLIETDSVEAKRGVMALDISSKWNMESQRGRTNLTIQLLSFANTTQDKVPSDYKLPIQIAPHLPPKGKGTKVPKGQDLYIALPVVFGSLILVLIGGCLWNRKTRRIQLGNVMGRKRGYDGRSTRRALGLSRGVPKNNDINLDVHAMDGEYRDMPDRRRRDSDELGDLVSTPTADRFQQQGTSGGNAFRDEMNRQNMERGGR